MITYGQRSTLGVSDSNLHINIEDQINKYPDPRRELLKRLSGKNFNAAVTSHKYEWSTRDNRAVKATLAFSTTGATATQLTVAEPGVLNKDDIFQDSTGAQYVVEAVAGGVVVTFRCIAGTQATIAGGATIKVVGGATPQGADADDMVAGGTSDLFNYTSNFEDVVDLSDMENESMLRGEESSGQLIARKQMELSEKLQNALIAGIRTKDDTYKVTTMGGLKYLIDTYGKAANIINFGGSSTWNTDAGVIGKIDDALDVLAAKAFEKPVMYVGAKFMRKFKSIQATYTQETRAALQNKGVGVVKKYMSHLFGDIDVVLIQERAGLLDDLVFFVDESQFGYKPFKGLGWHTYPLARVGQSFRWQVAGIYTCKLDIPEAAVYAWNLGV